MLFGHPHKAATDGCLDCIMQPAPLWQHCCRNSVTGGKLQPAPLWHYATLRYIVAYNVVPFNLDDLSR